MGSIISYEKGLVCQACGEERFTNDAFIYFVKCLGCVIHRYCLDVTPEICDEFVFWYCDDCKPAGPYELLLPKAYPSGPDKEDPTSTAIISFSQKQSAEADANSKVGYIHYQPARPVLEPVWRGSFNVVKTDSDLFEGVNAYLSSKACLKVYEEATTLPSLLRPKMQPKNTLWPKSFLESHPSDENIALYFFPGDPKNERVFEQLLNDMIEEELAMKTTTKNAQLLIFASTLLPQPYRRFQGNYYMWGVFKGKRNKSSSAAVQDVTVSNTSNNHMPERNEVKSGKVMLTSVKSVDSMSPHSP